MPYTLDPSGKIWRITFSGVLASGDLINAARELAQIEGSHPVVRHRLTDLRSITDIPIGFFEINELAKRRLALKFPNKFKSGIVADAPLSFGFARMFQTLNDHPQISIQIFSTENEALAWLSIEEDCKTPRDSENNDSGSENRA
jgi:hypothetical protein